MTIDELAERLNSKLQARAEQMAFDKGETLWSLLDAYIGAGNPPDEMAPWLILKAQLLARLQLEAAEVLLQKYIEVLDRDTKEITQGGDIKGASP